MKWVRLIVGLVVGFVAGAGSLVYLQERNRATQDTGEMSIIFAKKFYYDNSELVTVSGTLTGLGQAYPNNTYSIACFKERTECWLTSVSAIGTQQIGRMDPPYAYEVRKWWDSEVVAGDNGTLACIKTTVTIDRKSEQVLWVEEPVNQTKVMCAKSENKTRKFTIENSPGWDKIFGKKP
jgi:hypothetical protein